MSVSWLALTRANERRQRVARSSTIQSQLAFLPTSALRDCVNKVRVAAAAPGWPKGVPSHQAVGVAKVRWRNGHAAYL